MTTLWAFSGNRLDQPARPVEGRLWFNEASGIAWFFPDQTKDNPRFLPRRNRVGVFVFFTEDMANKARMGRAARALASPRLRYQELLGFVDASQLRRAVAGKKIFKHQR